MAPDDPNNAITLPELRTGLASRVTVSGDNLRTDVGFLNRAVDLAGNAFAVVDDTTDIDQINGANPFGITTNQGAISLVIGPRVAQAMSAGQVVFFADGGNPRSTGFDQRSLYLTVDATGGVADAVGFSIPTNPSRPAVPEFVARATGIDPNAFQHVSATWDGSAVELYINGERRTQVSATTVPFTVRFLDFGTSQELANVWRGRLDELRVSTVRRSEAFMRAEARSTLGQLVRLGAVERRP